MEHKQNEYFSQANKINWPYNDMVSTVPGKVTAKNSAHLWEINSSLSFVEGFYLLPGEDN